jgi:hypothetical protein
VVHDGYGADERESVVDVVADAHRPDQLLEGRLAEPRPFQDAAYLSGVGKPESVGASGAMPSGMLTWGAAAAPATMIHSLRSSPCNATNAKRPPAR